MRLTLPAAALALSGAILSGCDLFLSDSDNTPTSETSSFSTPALKTSAGTFLPFLTDLESESPECWGRRDAKGFNRAGCGNFSNIGPHGMALVKDGIRHSGSQALRATYTRNEDVAGSVLRVDEENIHVRTHFYFDKGFDFGQGVKIGRVSSFNDSKQANDIDIILAVGSSAGQQCGTTDMGYLGLHFNGRPTGYDWGSITPSVRFQREKWYSVEYQVKLNRPGQRDGEVRLWVDGNLVGEKTGINIRGGGGSGVRLNRVLIGGWYSNSARGNSCANPSQPSRLYMDDIEIARQYIGPQTRPTPSVPEPIAQPPILIPDSPSEMDPPVATSPIPAEPLPTPVVSVPLPSAGLGTDFETEDASCWNQSEGTRTCGTFSGITGATTALSTGIARTGRQALSITYTRNEQEAGATLAVAAETLSVKGDYYFDRSFDFAQGMVIGRVQGNNPDNPSNGLDIVVRTHSVPGNQCGVTDMRGIGIYSKGMPAGVSWSTVNHHFAFDRQRWYEVEYTLVLNAPGERNGEARLWINGELITEARGLDLRGDLSREVKLDAVRLGGWYSNGGNGNGCPSPDQPSRYYVDNVEINQNRLETTARL